MTAMECGSEMKGQAGKNGGSIKLGTVLTPVILLDTEMISIVRSMTAVSALKVGRRQRQWQLLGGVGMIVVVSLSM